MAVDLRTYVFLDSLQLQNASFIATVSKGYYPIGMQACCIIEIAPGIEINRLTDIALKATNVTPGLQIVERAYGLLEVHSDNQGDARMAGEAVLRELKLSEKDRLKPRVMTSQLIKNISDHHAQLINKVLLDGKKSLAERIVYGAFDIIEQKMGQDPLSVFKKAMDNVRPTLEVKPKRVGGATYQVPIEVNSRRSTTLAIRWIVGYARKRREKTMAERLAGEIMDAANGLGASVKKREDLYKMAESNRAFSHYRW